jgi:hypothetical protein
MATYSVGHRRSTRCHDRSTCAAAAVVSGEQHPLTTIVVEHGAALMVALRVVANPPRPSDTRVNEGQGTPSEPGRYQPIPVTIDETSSTSGDD